MPRLRFPVALFLLLLVPIAAQSATLDVPGDHATIQEAIDAAGDGDTLRIAAGTYTGPGNRNLLVVDKALAMIGAGPDSTTLNCEYTSRALACIQTSEKTLSLQGLGIVNGQMSGQAGGLLFSNGSVQLTNVSIRDCDSSGDGGALMATSLTQFSAWNLNVADCMASGQGGGLYLSGIADLYLYGCAVTGCIAVQNGGAMVVESSNGQINSTLVAQNGCSLGVGGISILPASMLDLSGITLADNLGSALQVANGGVATLTESVVAFNAGGASAIDALSYNFSLSCCDVYDNQPSDYGAYGDQTGQNGNIALDPRFCDADAGEYSVDPLSPCLPANNGCGVLMGPFGQGCLDYTSCILVPEDYPNLALAADAAESGDTIIVAPGVYSGPQNRDVDFGGKALHFIGREGAANTVIDCEGLGRAFYSGILPAGSTASIEGFTILDGAVDGHGGALYLKSSATIRLRDLDIRDCSATGIGGGIYIWYCELGSEIQDLAVTGCSAVRGGGIYLTYADLDLHDTLLADNVATAGEGGGLYSGVHNHLVASRMTLAGNSGGGAYFLSGSPDNSHEFSASIVSHSLGDAPAVAVSAGGADNLSFSCNDVWGNAGGDYGAILGDLSGQDGNISLDPLYCDASGGDYQLSFDSACLPANNGCGQQFGAFGEGCSGLPHFELTGRVLTDGGAPIVGAAVVWGGMPAITGVDGGYTITVPAGWSGSTHAEGGSYDYAPLQRDYSDVQTDQVDQDYTGTHRSLCWVPDDYANLGDAVDGCLDGDTIMVAAGVYDSADNGQILLAAKNLVVLGAEGSANTVFEGSASTFDAMITLSGSGQSSLLRGLTFRNAGFYGMSNGRAFLVDGGASPVFQDVVFENLDGWSDPWEMYSAKTFLCTGGSSPELLDCVFRSNYSKYSPIKIAGGAPVFTRVRFEQNDCIVGTVGVSGGNPLFSDCVFAENTANVTWVDDVIQVHGAGGALVINGGAPLFEDCLFHGNTAEADFPNQWDSHGESGKGGAVYLTGGTATFRRCTFHGNTALPFETLEGGAFGVFGGDLTLEQSILAASGDGGGIYLDDAAFAVILDCNDVWGNVGGDYLGALDDQTGSNGNISADPLFCGPGASDFTVMTSSPCLPLNNACGLQMGAFGEGCEDGTPVDETPPPSNFALLQNRPNPFNPATEIIFVLPAPARVSLRVFDTSGRRVATLLEGAAREAGQHRLTWPGRDDAGNAVASGVYFYRLEAGEFRDVKKMVLLK